MDAPATTKNERQPLYPVLYRPLAWMSAITVGEVLLALLLFMAVTWNNLDSLQEVNGHARLIEGLQRLGARLQAAAALPEERTPAALERIRADLQRLSDYRPGPVEESRASLTDAARLLAREPDELALRGAAYRVLTAAGSEMTLYDQRLDAAQAEARRNWYAAISLTFVLLALLAILVWTVRRRLLHPLDTLRTLMQGITRQDYAAMPLESMDGVLRPLMERYNSMVERLASLEQEHSQRERSLREEVHLAVGTLLQQQRRLAETEQLAAVGEVAARLAHEMRNPLAGVVAALGNLRTELEDPDQVQRVELVIGELQRVTRLLNDHLEQARQRPEPARELNLKEAVAAVLSLAGYQVAPAIRLENAVDQGLVCRLPEGRLRQSLLNLVLNAAQAMGGQEAGSVRVAATCEEGRLRLFVSDSGPGFPEHLLAQGIRSFASERSGGTGLGLATVRRLAHDLGGDLTLFNTEHGACVEFNLPCGN